jgi:Heterokaryon incompatibility protein (HET)
MRLLNSTSLLFRNFENEDEFPPYSILSHTWEQAHHEVSYQDMMTPDRSQLVNKRGFQKILKSAEKARKNDIQWIWVDTCCIDKSSSAELSEAINCKIIPSCAYEKLNSEYLAMFKWYQKSRECYVYLADVDLPRLPSSDYDEEDKRYRWFMQTKKSRWYTRGWTLQELVAPRFVQFYDQNWNLMGTKNRHRDALHEITKIPIDVLSGGNPHAKPVAQRMSWAAKRQTARKEDIAYCLLGIMDVNMPLLYGEGGERAFLRLQDQIISSYDDDQSIFAWTATDANSSTWRGLLAVSPEEFSDCSRLKRIFSSMDSDFQTSNRGVRVSLPMFPLGDNVYIHPPPPGASLPVIIEDFPKTEEIYHHPVKRQVKLPPQVPPIPPPPSLTVAPPLGEVFITSSPPPPMPPPPNRMASYPPDGYAVRARSPVNIITREDLVVRRRDRRDRSDRSPGTSPSPPLRDLEREENIIRRAEPPSPKVPPPPPPPPPPGAETIIIRPPTHQEIHRDITTHHWPIDHGIKCLGSLFMSLTN